MPGSCLPRRSDLGAGGTTGARAVRREGRRDGRRGPKPSPIILKVSDPDGSRGGAPRTEPPGRVDRRRAASPRPMDRRSFALRHIERQAHGAAMSPGTDDGPGVGLLGPARSGVLAGGVVAYNEERTIRAALLSLLDQELPPGVAWNTIWVVASGCTDRTVEEAGLVAARDPRVRLVVEPVRTGKATAVTEVLRRAQGDAVVLLNADARAMPGAVAALWEAAEGHPALVRGDGAQRGAARGGRPDLRGDAAILEHPQRASPGAHGVRGGDPPVGRAPAPEPLGDARAPGGDHQRRGVPRGLAGRARRPSGSTRTGPRPASTYRSRCATT